MSSLPAPELLERKNPLRAQLGWMTIGRFLAAAAQAAGLVLLARSIDPEYFGLVGALIGFLVIPQALFDVGVSGYIAREWFNVESAGVVSSALRITNWTALALGFVLVCGISGYGFLVSSTAFYALPLAIWAALEKNSEVWLVVATADRMARLVAASLVIRRVASLAGFVLLLVSGVEPVLAFGLAYCVVSWINNILVRRRISSLIPKGRPKVGLPRVLQATWPYWLHSSMTQFRNLDGVLTAAIAGPYQAGMYAVPSRTAGPLRLVPQALASVLLPHLARTGGIFDKSSRRVVATVLLLISMFYVGLAIAAEPIIGVSFGPAYEDSVLPFQITMIGLVFGALASILAAAAQSMGRAKQVGVSSLIASVVAITAVALGAHSSGAVGAASGVGVSFAAQSLMLFFVALRARVKIREGDWNHELA